MEGVIESNLDKECGALSGLFQQIIAEMKNGTPNFDEFVSRAGKLHTTLKNTILVLGSFLDSFQKIADSASNTKGATRDIGTCLTRIVIRHRALESRMKTLAGALMDCLVLPIQGKLEEWKKSAIILDKEHSKGHKKTRTQIKKKSEQVARLKKKLKKEKVPDPSVQRLWEQCSKDLNTQYKNFERSERLAVTKALSEDRNRYCTFVAFLKPVLDEEIAMFTEIHQIEDILAKLNRTASLKESTEVFVEDFVNKNGVGSKDQEDNRSLCLTTPPSTPSTSSSMGSRKGSMSSLDSGGSTSNSSVSIHINASPTRRSIHSGPDYEVYSTSKRESNGSTRPSSSLSHKKAPLSHLMGGGGEPMGRPMSSTSWDGGNHARPHTISAVSSFDKRHSSSTRPPILPGSFAPNTANICSDSELDDINSSNILNQFNCSNFSTVKRSYRTASFSPFHRVSDSHAMMKRPPLPQRCSSADRSLGGSLSFNSGPYSRCASIDRGTPTSHQQQVSKPVMESGPHYAIPKPTLSLHMVPNFHSDKKDMVIPHPVYMNCKDLDNMKKCNNAKMNTEVINGGGVESSKQGGSLELPPEEDLKTPTVEELAFPGKKVTTSTEDASSSSSGSIGSSSGYGSQCTIKFEENGPSCPVEGQGCSPSHPVENNPPPVLLPRSISSDSKPPPPMRRSSIGSKENSAASSPSKSLNVTFAAPPEAPTSFLDEDDTTPRGSLEDLPPMMMMTTEQPTSILRRSTSMSGPPHQILERTDRFRRSYQPGGEKGSLFSTLSSKLNQRLKIEERPDTRKPKSPDGEEKYGFGLQFQSSRRDYFLSSDNRDGKESVKLRLNSGSNPS